LIRKPQNPEPLRLTVPTVTDGVPIRPARITPPCSDRLKLTVALIELAVTVIVEPPMQHVVPHARTVSRTFGNVMFARRPPLIRVNALDGVPQLIEFAL
jgi:hypothetical protein